MKDSDRGGPGRPPQDRVGPPRSEPFIFCFFCFLNAFFIFFCFFLFFYVFFCFSKVSLLFVIFLIVFQRDPLKHKVSLAFGAKILAFLRFRCFLAQKYCFSLDFVAFWCKIIGFPKVSLIFCSKLLFFLRFCCFLILKPYKTKAFTTSEAPNSTELQLSDIRADIRVFPCSLQDCLKKSCLTCPLLLLSSPPLPLLLSNTSHHFRGRE